MGRPQPIVVYLNKYVNFDIIFELAYKPTT